MGMLRQTEACILTLFWRFVQPFFAFVPLLVDSLRLLAWDSSFIPWPLAPIVTGRAFYWQITISYSFTQIPTSLFLFLIDSESHNGHWQLLQPLEFQRCYDRLPTPANEYTFMIMTGRPEGPSQPILSIYTWQELLVNWGAVEGVALLYCEAPLCVGQIAASAVCCPLVHQITRLELRPSPYCCWPSMRTAHDCDTIRMQHFHRNSASDKQEQDCL